MIYFCAKMYATQLRVGHHHVVLLGVLVWQLLQREDKRFTSSCGNLGT